MGNRHPTIVPYETFRAADGDFVIAVGNDEQWRRFCAVTGIEPEARFATNRQRVTGYAELKPILDRRLAAEPRAYWIEKLAAAAVPCGSVRDLHELFGDPQVAARSMMSTVMHPTIGALSVLGTPLKLSATPPSVRTPPPTLGEHTDAVLTRELGYRPEEVAAFRAGGVV
jgi:formyl-CoA transferase